MYLSSHREIAGFHLRLYRSKIIPSIVFKIMHILATATGIGGEAQLDVAGVEGAPDHDQVGVS